MIAFALAVMMAWPSGGITASGALYRSDFEPVDLLEILNRHRLEAGRAPLLADPALVEAARERALYLAAEFPGRYLDYRNYLISQGKPFDSAARQAAYLIGHATNPCGADRVRDPDIECPNIWPAERLRAVGYAGHENVAFERTVEAADAALQRSGTHRLARMRTACCYGWAVADEGPYLIVVELIAQNAL